MKTLLTGGLGYIGSHIAYYLKEKAVIIDNKTNSNLNYKKYIPHAKVYELDVNIKSLKKIFKTNAITSVIHLSSLKAVEESVYNPIKYYKNNVSSSMDLIEAIDEFNIRKLIFSSSATVYGNQQKAPFKENYSLSSTNPYGNTKIIIEKLIDDYSKSNKFFKSISLRYFNPIGADLKSGLSDQPLGKPLNIIPILNYSVKNKKVFKIYGNDYKTKDGTCLRDFIHVSDLAKAHIVALKKINKIQGHEPINLGLGKCISVLDIIKLYEKINKVKVNYKFAKRRKGDLPISYADNKKALNLLDWKPIYTYDNMVYDSWNSFSNNL